MGSKGAMWESLAVSRRRPGCGHSPFPGGESTSFRKAYGGSRRLDGPRPPLVGPRDRPRLKFSFRLSPTAAPRRNDRHRSGRRSRSWSLWNHHPSTSRLLSRGTSPFQAFAFPRMETQHRYAFAVAQLLDIQGPVMSCCSALKESPRFTSLTTSRGKLWVSSW
jgi:hypothetical protein